jgi:hypothetical protein
MPETVVTIKLTVSKTNLVLDSLREYQTWLRGEGETPQERKDNAARVVKLDDVIAEIEGT